MNVEPIISSLLKVRHDTVARYAAPLVAYASPAKVVEAPTEVIEAGPALSPLTSDVLLPSPYHSTVMSAPQVYATGAAQVVAVIINLQ